MDQLQSIRVFARVVQAGTFTKAAESLDMPKGTVTKLVQHLESRLKVKLLNRTTRKVTVTPDGAAYYERTARVLNDLDDIETGITNAQARPSGRLRVDMGTAVARDIIIPALPDFYRKFPDIQIDLGVTDRTVNLLADNVDCVIRGGELLDESLIARRVANIGMMTVASPAYLQEHGMPAHPQELETGHTVVNYFSARNGRTFANVFEQNGQRFEVFGRNRLSVNDSNAIATAALNGLGVVQMLSFSAMPLIARGDLVRVLENWKCTTIPLYVVYPPNRHLSARVRAFVEWVAVLCSKHSAMSD